MDDKTFNISGTLSPTRNPFGNGNIFDPDTFTSTSIKDISKPSLIISNNDDLFSRGTLGILPNPAHMRDSLIDDILSTSIRDSLVPSPKESLGILNISSMDLDRESIGIFNINNPIFKKEFNDNERQCNLGLYGFQSQMISPLILINDIEEKIDSCNLTDLNKGFLLPHSRKISEVSSRSSAVSTNPSFNAKSFEEPSKISGSFLHKDAEESLMSTVDHLNEAFQLSACVKGNSMLYKSTGIHYSFANELERIRNRIRSLPTTLENLAIDYKTDKISFDEGLICRGIEDERDLEDSVFLQNEKRINEDTSFNCEGKSFDEERYILDCTPQPDWDELDLSKSNNEKSPVLNKESVFKQVDKMLGMQPVNLEEKLNLRNNDKCDDGCSVNISQNISKISRASQCSIPENPSYMSNNASQDVSKISKSSEEGVFMSVQALTNVINKKENLSESQRTKLHHMLHCITDTLLDNVNMDNENSFEPPRVESRELVDKNKQINSDESAHETSIKPLDLSCKKKSCDSLSLSKSSSVRSPPPYVDRSLNHTQKVNTSDMNRKSVNMARGSPSTNYNKVATSVEPLRRHSNITQNKISTSTETLKKTQIRTVSSKRGPLRAVLPVENMAKAAKAIDKCTTPESKVEVKKLTLKSNKTSTPLQEPKLRPMASSTPQARRSQDVKENSISNANAGKPKLTRSFSYHSRVSTALDQGTNNRKYADLSTLKSAIGKSSSKLDGTKMLRRNSVTGNIFNRETDSEGSPKFKRSSSTGKESKIMSALNRVRQNLLNSPHYQANKNTVGVRDKIDAVGGKVVTDLNKCNSELKTLSKITARRVGKENLKP